jgi:hypothetical protein
LGVLLAGGRGVRMGADVPKALVRLEGRTLLAHAIATMRACVARVFVVTPESLDLGDLTDVTRVADPPGRPDRSGRSSRGSPRPPVRRRSSSPSTCHASRPRRCVRCASRAARRSR